MSQLLTLQQRIESIKGTKQSNCIGTALYIVGLQDRDELYNTHMLYSDFLKKLQRVETPTEGCLVAWYGTQNREGKTIFDRLAIHAGIITSIEPLRITHRGGVGEIVKMNEEFEKVNKEYFATAPGHTSGRVEFYQVPNLII